MAKPFRFAIGGFYHETNTFSAKATRLADFKAYQYAADDALIERYRDSNTEIGGMIAEAVRQGIELVPLVFAAAVPSGLIEGETFKELVDDLVLRIGRAGAIDGLVLALHGAAAADAHVDADGFIVAAMRDAVGPGLPIGVTLDFHANLGRQLVEVASFICGYDTYPHTDMAERGAECMRVIADIAQGRPRPQMSFRKLPFVTVPLTQATGDSPMREISNALAAAEEETGIVSATITMGFAYADSPNLGASVLVYAQDKSQAEHAATRLTDLLWSRREAFLPTLVDATELGAALQKGGQYPVLVVDPADNVGGGSAGDGTIVLSALIEARAAGSVVVIADPEAVRAADRAGAGQSFDALVGGKIDHLHGPPVRIRGTVVRVLDARFRHAGSYMTGFVTDMGRTAVIDADGVLVVVTSLRTMPFDVGHLTCVGITPERQRAIVVKSAIAWRAAFGDIARRSIVVDTPGVCPANLSRLAFGNAPRPLWPIDPGAEFK